MSIARRILLILIAVMSVNASIIAVFYAVENHRGARDWADARRALEARGQSLDLMHFIPAQVPDERNLALAPFFDRLYQYRVDPVTGLLTFNHEGNTNAAKTVDTIPFGLNGGPVSGGPGWQAGQTMDLTRFQQFYQARKDFPHAASPQSPAADVLLALTRFDPLLDELTQEAASHPDARFPVNWTQKPAAAINLPHGNLVQKLVILLRLRACSSLASGQPEPALNDVFLGFRLRGAIGQEPMIIGSLVDVTCCGLLMQPVWDGLAARRWSAAQLSELQTAMSTVDLLGNYRHGLEAERAFFILPLFDELRQAKNLNNVRAMVEMGGEKERWPWWMSALNQLFPRGWYDEGKAVVSRLDQQYAIDPLDAVHHRVDARKIEEGNALVHNLPVKPTTFVAKICLPVSSSVAVKIAHGQAFIDQAVVACALERFFLDHQTYPPNLDALVPVYLGHIPADVIDGAPMRYQPTPDGRYRLWEVGWNGQDEAGKIVWQKDTTRPDDRQGDWVWQYESALPQSGHPNDK